MYVTVIQAKIASMLVIGVGSFIVGIAPACFVSRARELQQKLLLSCALCFGAGVLLATSVLHLLPEVRESLPQHAELVFSCGFLLLYFVDECVHYFWGNDVEHSSHSHSHDRANVNSREYGESSRRVSSQQQMGYNVAAQSITALCMPDSKLVAPYQSNFAANNAQNNARKTSNYGTLQFSATAPAPCCNEEATFLCHGPHTVPCSDASAGLLGLLIALTFHAVLEGLAIGLQKQPTEVLLLVGAVASHKFVVGFCLGLELASVGSSTWRLVAAIFVFASGSAVGIGIGMLMFQEEKPWSIELLSILQGLAAGTLLYVTVSEVLPRERARWHRNDRRLAGILQFVAVVSGFVVIFLFNEYLST